MQEWLSNPFVAGAIAGVVSAAAADIAAFRSWKSFDDAKVYSWNVAAWRWFQGAVMGLLAAAGIAGLT
jgi:hypothetical protein